MSHPETPGARTPRSMAICRALIASFAATVLAGMLSTGTALAAPKLPELDLDVRLDPLSRQLDVTATLKADAGADDLRWQLAPAAGVDPRLLTLPASTEPRTRVLRYSLQLEPTAQRSHRDTLSSTAATAGAQGSFLPAASLWHPLPLDGGSFTYRVTLALPADQRGLVPGTLVSESIEAGRQVAHFAFDHPAQGIDLMAGPYLVEERVLEAPAGVRLRTYFHAELQSLAGDYLDAAAAYLRRYSAQIGPYPYAGFSIVSSPTPTGFGMPTLTYLGIDVLKLPFIRHTSLGHEVLHNWWGNGVQVDYEQGNWCEGLTTFMADYAYKEQDGPQAARQSRLAWLRDLSALPAGEAGTLRRFTARTHGASQIIGYHKAAMLFLMLRDRMGEERFQAGLRQFWRTHRFRSASWFDIQHAIEESSGESLAQLIGGTLDHPGLPMPAVARAAMHGDSQLRVTLRQTLPVLPLRVPLRVLGEFGSLDVNVDMNAAEQTYLLQVPSRATGVMLDPELRLLRQLSPGEQPPILRQVMVASKVALELPDADEPLREHARALAAGVLDNAPVASGATAFLLIGTHAAIDDALRRLSLQRPPALQEKGSAQVWAARTASDQPVMVVSVRDATALQALSRPLPHYGGQGYLAFDGGKAIERGQWPAQVPVIEIEQ